MKQMGHAEESPDVFLKLGYSASRRNSVERPRRDRTKSGLRRICSEQSLSAHSSKIMRLFFRLVASLGVLLLSIVAVLAQAGPDTTRLLRFPTTNGDQIVFCYAGQLYTVSKDGG